MIMAKNIFTPAYKESYIPAYDSHIFDILGYNIENTINTFSRTIQDQFT
jgi:hypothetical protein